MIENVVKIDNEIPWTDLAPGLRIIDGFTPLRKEFF